MKKYETPLAQTVAFEAVNIIAASGANDTREKLNTWGSNVEDVDSQSVNLFK